IDWAIPNGINSTDIKIRASLRHNGNRFSARDTVGGITIDSSGAPAAPVTNVETVVTGNDIELSWQNPTDPLFDHVVIYRSDDERFVGEIVHETADDTVEAWLDASASSDTTYFYRIRSVSTSGSIGRSYVPGELDRS